MLLWRLLKKIVKYLITFIIFVFLISTVFAVIGYFKCPDISDTVQTIAAQKSSNSNIKEYDRPLSSSYLTYPEWYIVYSSREYANLLKDKLPSKFPYFSAIEQYWCGYKTVTQLTKHYPFNFDNHLMLMVIGMSLSAEYTVKGIYENSVGRLSEWLSDNQPVEEDRYAQQVAQQYVDFIPLRPWFEFSFYDSLCGLWQQTSWLGPHMVRKWERKLILSVEYSVKAVYGWLIGLGSHAALGEASDYVYANIHSTPAQFARCPGGKIIKKISMNEFIVAMPHEQPFTKCIDALSKTKSSFIDIAGNSDILVSVMVPVSWENNLKNVKVLFSMKILTEPTRERVVFLIPVNKLLTIVNELYKKNILIEHVYDY